MQAAWNFCDKPSIEVYPMALLSELFIVSIYKGAID
jgi:hypothetical protein